MNKCVAPGVIPTLFSFFFFKSDTFGEFRGVKLEIWLRICATSVFVKKKKQEAKPSTEVVTCLLCCRCQTSARYNFPAGLAAHNWDSPAARWWTWGACTPERSQFGAGSPCWGSLTQKNTLSLLMPKDRFKTKQNKKHNSTSKINVASWLQLLPQLHSGRRLSIQAQSDLQVPAVQADAVPQAVVHSFTCRGRFSSVTEGGCVILGDMPYFCAHLFFFFFFDCFCADIQKQSSSGAPPPPRY